jgi:hypothetical protein
MVMGGRDEGGLTVTGGADVAPTICASSVVLDSAMSAPNVDHLSLRSIPAPGYDLSKR